MNNSRFSSSNKMLLKHKTRNHHNKSNTIIMKTIIIQKDKSSEITNETTTGNIDTQIEISSEILEEANEQEQLERQTILHCRLSSKRPTFLRIHPNTFIIENGIKKRKMITTHDIAIAPQWGSARYEEGFHYFTLIFEGLSENCKGFFLKETAAPNEKNLFYSDWVERNKTDVYDVEIFVEMN
jgi:hypothetical protein